SPAFISFLKTRALFLMPSLYLFLDIDISQTSNPIVRELEARLERREPIGFALPRFVPSPDQLRSPESIALEQLRLFAFSQDAGMLREAENHKDTKSTKI